MRPVNLIPPEDRRGDRAPLRTGATSYVIVAALAVALAAVSFVVITGNKISEREAEVASLEVTKVETSARAEALRPYAEFAAISEARDLTVTSLAQSRFDWERVLNELALVIPDDVWLVKVAGSVSPDAQVSEGAAVESRASVAGPALELIGCGANTEAVARFLAALKDVDGVTRVGIDRAERREPTANDGSSSVGATDTASEECRTRDFISRFEIVAAFDAVVPATAAPAAPGVVPGTETAAVTGPGSESVADAQAAEQAARESTAEQTEEAGEATELIPGGGTVKATDRTILLGVVLLGLLAAFWFLVAAPKRERLSTLGDDVTALEQEIAAEEELLATAEQSKNSFRSDYHRLVVLGKAVPGDEDSASLIEQTNALAARSGIEFRSLVLTPDAGAGTAPPAPAAETSADPGTEAAEVATEAAGAPVAAPATEAIAATLPIGAAVGPAGLPVMPYDLAFRGSFFEIADFFGRLDGMVRVSAKGVGVDGRLLTIDSFALSGDKADGFPLLAAKLHVTTYVTPADQGMTAGATESAPAAVPGAPVSATPTAASTP